MPDKDGTEKTEQATPKKRGEARRKGNVAKSQDLALAILLFVYWGWFALNGPRFFRDLSQLIEQSISRIGPGFDFQGQEFWTIRDVGITFLGLVLPFFATTFVVQTTVGLFQTNFNLAPESLQFDLNRLNPINGLKKLFSLRSLVRTAMAAVKFSIFTLLVYLTVRGEWDRIGATSGASLGEMAEVIGSLFLTLLSRVAIALLLLAILDLLYQRWQYERDLMMTKQEVKEEYKQADGDPEVKRRIRRRQREISGARMMEEVKSATVVVVNPVHVSIALRYEDGRTAAPLLVAKGKGWLARRIREIAEERNIPVVENPPVARLLYRFVGTGTEIPPRFYVAVAEILGYLYRIGRLSPEAVV